MAAVQAPHEHLLTPAEVAALVFVDPKTVSRWASAGKIASTRTPGGHRRFRRCDVEALMAQGTGQGLDIDPVARDAAFAAAMANALQTQAAAGAAAAHLVATAVAGAAAAMRYSTTVRAGSSAVTSSDTELAAARVAQAVTDAAAHVAVRVAAFDLALEREASATAEALHDLTVETARHLAQRNHAVTRRTSSL